MREHNPFGIDLSRERFAQNWLLVSRSSVLCSDGFQRSFLFPFDYVAIDFAGDGGAIAATGGAAFDHDDDGVFGLRVRSE